MRRITVLIPRPATPKAFATRAAAATFACLALTPLLFAGQPALTIYNQNFAVVRDTVSVDLKQGVNNVRFTETTAHLEPDSVILRDSTGKNEPANPRAELSERSGFAGIAAVAF
jgi:hypothetical protein